MKQFKPTSWSIDNRTSIYLLTVIITLFGIWSYGKLQKENFPDISIPNILVSTVYPGTSPADMENLVTRPLEKRMKGISGVKRITSTSLQDFAIIVVEFNSNENIDKAKQQVKDKIDEAAADLPKDLPAKPTARDINLSDVPILYVNVSGDVEMEKLKQYAEDIKDKIEGLKEITRVDMAGALEKEFKVDVDQYKMQSNRISLYDIQTAIKSENLAFSVGSVSTGEVDRNIRISGQFTTVDQIRDLVIRNPTGGAVYLRDIADVVEGYEERESYARLDHKPVVTLSVVKRAGENLIDASDKIRDIVKDFKDNKLPKNVDVVLTADQSSKTRNTLNDLINTIIIGFILVTLILMFFMGTTNALFVALSVPLSTFLAFMVMPLIGGLGDFSYTLNMIVLFSFLLALGIVVDDAIVVIENTHRIYHQGHTSIERAAKSAAGEVFVPVLAGTLTTLAPFFPLLFWPGIIGKFMFYLPITLIIVLLASLLIAFIINPVFAVSYMHKEDPEIFRKRPTRSFWITNIVLLLVGILGHASGSPGFGNVVLTLLVFILLNRFVFTRWIYSFQNGFLPRLRNGYGRAVSFVLKWPKLVLFSVFAILIVSFLIFGALGKPPTFFPQGDPNFIYTYIEMPVGTDLEKTDSVAKVVESRVYDVVGRKNHDVESVITNVAVGAGNPNDPISQSTSPHRAKVAVAFVELGERRNGSTMRYMNQIREKVKGIPGADIVVEKEANGPPTGKPINVEISGEDLPGLITLSRRVEQYLDSVNVPGIEDLRSDLKDRNQEISIVVNRERANREGITTGQIIGALRMAIVGPAETEVSKFKKDEDEYPIPVRLKKEYRENLDKLLNMPITYRDMASGQVRQVPLSSVVDVQNVNTLGAVKRKNLKRVITLSSNLLGGYNENQVAGLVRDALTRFKVPTGYEVKMTGAQEDQAETAGFLGFAGLMGICLIVLILVTQFNSISKPVIIMTEVLFSIAGVLLGFALTGMEMSVVMTGVGIVALAGIVVKNGILLVEFADVLRERGYKTRDAIIEAGKARLNPVILTATACILGLVPLALGMNINFFTLFSEGNPDFYLGGESVVFWGPLAWTIIFGLSFATFLTLLVVPAMYLLNYRFRLWLKRKRVLSRNHKL